MLENRKSALEGKHSTVHEPASAKRVPVSRKEMVALFDYLEDELVIDACDHSLRLTQAFLTRRGIDVAAACQWIREYGATCDCDILQTIELEWR